MAIIQFTQQDAGTDTTVAAADYQHLLTRLYKDLPGATTDPSQLGQDLQKLIGGTDQQAGGLSVLGGLRALRRLVAFGKEVKTVVETTPSRIQQAVNQRAIIGVIRQKAVIEMARLSSEETFQSVNEAIAVKDEIAELLDLEAADATDDTLFGALKDLRSAVVRDISTRSADLSRIEQRPPIQRSNSLVMAYRLYGDATREGEIAERNELPMPGFIFPNQSVQVLND